jgi:hypothetical protein
MSTPDAVETMLRRCEDNLFEIESTLDVLSERTVDAKQLQMTEEKLVEVTQIIAHGCVLSQTDIANQKRKTSILHFISLLTKRVQEMMQEMLATMPQPSTAVVTAASSGGTVDGKEKEAAAAAAAAAVVVSKSKRKKKKKKKDKPGASTHAHGDKTHLPHNRMSQEPAPRPPVKPQLSELFYWTTEQVQAWLQASKWSKYSAKFQELSVTGEGLMDLKEHDLVDTFLFENLLHSRGLIRAIIDLRYSMIVQ